MGKSSSDKTGIVRVIASFKEIVSQGNIKFDIENTTIKPVKRLLNLFNTIEDMRVNARIVYQLGELLLAAFVAVMSGADSFVAIENFCNIKIDLLRKFTPLADGIPSHDTFRRIFSLLDPQCLQEVTVAYLLDNIKLMRRAFGIDGGDLRHLCVDGKTARGSGRLKDTEREIPKIHTLHVYDATNGICLVSKIVGEKTNEIPEAQNILKCMDLRDTIVTFDAMNTQRNTIAAIVVQKGHYIGALKGNQSGLLEEVESYFTPARLSRIKASKANCISYSEKAHNCVETRTYWLTKNVDWLVQLGDWLNLKAFIRYEKKSVNLVTGKERREIYFYISSITNISDCADAIRGHWGVENLLHWHLDVNFREDDCTIADRKAFQNISLMNKLALSLYKLAAPIFKVSIKSTRLIAGWSTEDVLKTLCAFDEDVIENAMLGVDPNAGRKSRLKIPED